MSKNKQIIIFSLIGIAVLGAVTAVLMLTAPKAEEGEETPVNVAEEKPVIFETEALVSKLTVSNEKGEFVITSEGEGYTIKEIEKAPLLTDSIASAATSLSSLTADQLVEETEDLTKYGLAEPRATVTAEYSDGHKKTFKIGDDVPNTTTKVYLTADDKTVYTCLKSKISAYLNGKYSFVNTLVIPACDQQSGELIERLTVERADLTEPVVIESIEEEEDTIQVYSYRMVSPYKVYMDLDKSSSFLYSVFSLSAASVQQVGLTEEDYENAGLNNPSCKIRIETTMNDYTLTLGLPLINTVTDEEGKEKKELLGFYGMSSTVPDVLYLFSADSIPASTVAPESLISRLFLMPYIYSLEKVEYSDNEGRSFVLGFETIKGEATVNENGETVEGEETHYHYLNGEKYDEQRIKNMYQFLISASGEEIYTDEEKGGLIATIVYNYLDKEKGENGKDIVSFYESESDRKVIININGSNLFKTPRIYITQLFSNTESFLAGEDIVLTY